MLVADITQQQLNELLAENSHLKQTCKLQEQDIETIVSGVMGLLKNFGVTNEDGSIPERLNMTRIGKRIMPVFVQKFNPLSDKDGFGEMIQPLEPVYPLYNKYQHLIK